MRLSLPYDEDNVHDNLFIQFLPNLGPHDNGVCGPKKAYYVRFI